LPPFPILVAVLLITHHLLLGLRHGTIPPAPPG